MNIFGLFSLFGGLAMFLYGMNVMGSGLEKLGGGKFEQILEKLTSNPIKGVVWVLPLRQLYSHLQLLRLWL